jgi:hypothetical protein
MATFQHVKEITPPLPNFRVNFNFPQLPSLPALPRFVTRDAVESSRNPKLLKMPKPSKAGAKTQADDDDDAEELKPPVLLKRGQSAEKSTGKAAAPTASAKAQAPAVADADVDDGDSSRLRSRWPVSSCRRIFGSSLLPRNPWFRILF